MYLEEENQGKTRRSSSLLPSNSITQDLPDMLRGTSEKMNGAGVDLCIRDLDSGPEKEDSEAIGVNLPYTSPSVREHAVEKDAPSSTSPVITHNLQYSAEAVIESSEKMNEGGLQGSSADLIQIAEKDQYIIRKVRRTKLSISDTSIKSPEKMKEGGLQGSRVDLDQEAEKDKPIIRKAKSKLSISDSSMESSKKRNEDKVKGNSNDVDSRGAKEDNQSIIGLIRKGKRTKCSIFGSNDHIEKAVSSTVLLGLNYESLSSVHTEYELYGRGAGNRENSAKKHQDDHLIVTAAPQLVDSVHLQGPRAFSDSFNEDESLETKELILETDNADPNCQVIHYETT